MWLLTIHRSFRPSPVLLLVAISVITCAQLTMFPTLKTCKATAAGAFLSWTNFETGSKLAEFSGIVVSARANQYSTKAPSSFWSVILNSGCRSHGRRPFSAPWHLSGRCFTHTQSFRRSPPRQLWLPVHRHIWDMHSPSKPSTWTLIPWWIQSSIACSCSSDIYVLLQLLCFENSRVPLYITVRCVASCVLSSNALKSLIIASGCFPSRRFWGPMNSGFAYDWGLPDQHRKGGLCRRQRCCPDAERGLGDWALSFRSRGCDAERWLLVAGSWDCDWRHSNHPWGLFYVLVHVSWQNTVARLRIDKSVRPNETSSGSSHSWSRLLTPWKYLSHGWYNPATRSFHAASWTASQSQHLVPRLPFASSRVPFSGHWLLPLPFCWLARVRKHLWRCENDARRPPCSAMLHHREIYIEHTYRILTLPVCTQLRDWIWDAERGFHLIETGLQLQSGTGTFPSSPSHSSEKLLLMTYFLMWGSGKQARMNRLHCTCRAVPASSWSGKSTSGGGQGCRSALYGGGRA